MKEKPSATAMAEKVSTAAKQQPMAEMIDTGAVATKYVIQNFNFFFSKHSRFFHRPESPKGARAEGEGRDEKSEGKNWWLAIDLSDFACFYFIIQFA